MAQQFRVAVIGGGILGGACAIALSRRLGPGQVALLENRVVGSGLSARHSAIVRAVHRSPVAVRMAREAANIWRRLRDHWGVGLTCRTPGALWIVPSQNAGFWDGTARNLKREGVAFERLSPEEAADLCAQAVVTDPKEAYFHEPEAMALDTVEVLTALQQALRRHSVAVFEHCPVRDILRTDGGAIESLDTGRGRFSCDWVVNAAGAWSTRLFARCGLTVPVALEPVLAANFLTGSSDLPEALPIIADQVHGFYIRPWPGSQLHVHRPRSRDPRAIRAAFTLSALALEGAEQIYGAANLSSSPEALLHYQRGLRKRFVKVINPVPLAASRSFFDITPDLGFILGPDPRAGNLLHCLGAGQAFKFAPVFGEIISALVCGEDPGYDLKDFSIRRFFGGKPGEILFPAQSVPF